MEKNDAKILLFWWKGTDDNFARFVSYVLVRRECEDTVGTGCDVVQISLIPAGDMHEEQNLCKEIPTERIVQNSWMLGIFTYMWFWKHRFKARKFQEKTSDRFMQDCVDLFLKMYLPNSRYLYMTGNCLSYACKSRVAPLNWMSAEREQYLNFRLTFKKKVCLGISGARNLKLAGSCTNAWCLLSLLFFLTSCIYVSHILTI